MNCAFLTILRAHALLSAARLAAFSSDLLVLFGLVSMAVAAVFILGQADFKRMLAYSSVEHIGILALGIGIGGVATFGAMLHTVNHSLTKAMLFLAAGNILAVYRTKSTTRVRGMLRTMPITAVLWLAGFLAIVGSPPFGPFLSELTILKGVLDAGRPLVAIAYLAALAVVFVGMATIFLRMAYGLPPSRDRLPTCPTTEPSGQRANLSYRRANSRVPRAACQPVPPPINALAGKRPVARPVNRCGRSCRLRPSGLPCWCWVFTCRRN